MKSKWTRGGIGKKHLDEDNQDFPLHVVLIHVLCTMHLQKNMTVFEIFVRNFTLADKIINHIISIRVSLKRQKAKHHEMCPDDI
jgi:hypothetical protein